MKKMVLILGVLLFVASGAMALPLNNGPSLIDPGVGGAIESSGQATLQSIVDDVFTFPSGSLDVVNDQTGVAGWTEGESDVSSYLVSLGFAVGNGTPYNGNFGIYDLQDSSRTQQLIDTTAEFSSNFDIYNGNLFVGSSSDPVSSGWSGAFGFYFQTKSIISNDDGTITTSYGAIRYTEDDKNTNNGNYAATYLLEDGTSWDNGAHAGFLYDGHSGLDNDWLIAFDGNDVAYDSIGNELARDFNDGIFIVEDLNPVPEPATLLLLGSGLVGLAFLKRRKA